jgi:hypothetical protein
MIVLELEELILHSQGFYIINSLVVGVYCIDIEQDERDQAIDESLIVFERLSFLGVHM